MAKNKPLKIIIDTNLWISFLISDKLRMLDSLLFSRKISLIFSEELFEEIRLTISKPKLKKYFTSKEAFQEMLLVIEPFIDLIEVKSIVKVCRDPNDNFLLALANDSKANYLLTGDNDLLELKKFDKCKIITISEFMSLNI